MTPTNVMTLWIASLATGVIALLAGMVAANAYRAGFRPATARGLGFGVVAGLLGWLAVSAALAEAGVLAFSPAHPPLEPLLPSTLFAAYLLLSRTATFGALARVIPPWQPVAAQTFRIGVELLFWRLYLDGRAPVQVTFEGRSLEILVGLTAPLVALGVGAGWVGRRSLVVWNILGVLVLFNTIGTAATSAPGPQHLDWPGEPFTALGEWPVIWIPALFAPTALFLHYVSIRQALGKDGELHGDERGRVD